MRKIPIITTILFIFCMSTISSHEKISITADIIDVNFNVRVKCDTPRGEIVCVQIEDQWPIFELDKVGMNRWNKIIKVLNFNIGNTIRYRYCRNHMFLGADESFNKKNKMGYREVELTNFIMNVNDVVKKWRWWPVDGEVPLVDTSSYLSEVPDFLPRKSFQCGIQFPDFWWDIFSSYVEPTLDKMRIKSNANWVEYNPIPAIVQYYPEPRVEKIGNNGIPDNELIEIIQTAHMKGLKVFLDPGPWPDGVEDTSPHYHSDDWWKAWRKEWKKIMVEYAQLAEEYNVEMLGFRIIPTFGSLSQYEVPIVNSIGRSILKAIRQVYKGIICLEFDIRDPELIVYGEVDCLGHTLWNCYPWNLGNSKNPSVEEMVATLKYHLDNELLPILKRYGKNLIIPQIGVCSYDGSTLGDPYFETQIYYEPDDPKVPLDLQEQADGYEAILREITKRKWIQGTYSFNYNYWDSLDKAPSIRAKPAERDVVSKWYGWAQGKFAKIDLNKHKLLFKRKEGKIISPKHFLVRNLGIKTINYKLSCGRKWVKLKPRKGKSKGEWDLIEVSIDAKLLNKGIHTAVIKIKSPNANNSPEEVEVEVSII